MKLSICLIVGNEEHRILTCLRSIRSIADEITIVRAIGNQKPDETLNLARHWCSVEGIPMKESEYLNAYHGKDWPHVDDFAQARQQSFGLATGDWCMWIDADDVWEENEANDELIRGVKAGKYEEFTLLLTDYRVPSAGGHLLRERFAKRSLKPTWTNPVHESLSTRDLKMHGFPDAYVLHTPQKTTKASLDRNLRILEYVNQHPEYDCDHRIIAFYLHRELMEAGRKKEAIEAARKALTAGLGEIEHYETLMNLADMLLEEGNVSEARAAAHGAVNTMPWRREAYALLAQIEMKEKKFLKMLGYTMAMRGIDEPKGLLRPWSQRDRVYGWFGAFLHHQALRYCNRIEEAEREEENVFQMEGGTISIIHPTMYRADLAMATYNNWMSMAKNPGAVQYIFAVDKDDGYTRQVLKGFRTIICPRGALAAVEHARKFATGKRVEVIADSWRPVEGWDENFGKVTIRRGPYKMQRELEHRKALGFPEIVPHGAILEGVPRFIICAKEGEAPHPDFQPQHCHFELGWEVNTSHVYAKWLLSQGKLTREDIIVTLPGRQFLYQTCFDTVLTWKEFCGKTGFHYGLTYPDASSETTYDLVEYFERNWHRYDPVYFSDNGKWGGGAWDSIQSFKEDDHFNHWSGGDYLLVSLRKRPHESRRDTKDEFSKEVLQSLHDALGLPIYLVGLNLPDYGVKDVSGVSLQEFATLMQHPNCRAILGPHSGPNGLAGLLAPKDKPIVIFPQEFCPSINGNFPTGMGKCLNLNGNIRHWLNVGASPDDIVAKAKEILL